MPLIERTWVTCPRCHGERKEREAGWYRCARCGEMVPEHIAEASLARMGTRREPGERRELPCGHGVGNLRAEWDCPQCAGYGDVQRDRDVTAQWDAMRLANEAADLLTTALYLDVDQETVQALMPRVMALALALDEALENARLAEIEPCEEATDAHSA